MKPARMPSDFDTTGIPSSAHFLQETTTLFHEWGYLTTDPFGEMGDKPEQGYVEAGTALLTHYRILANGKPLIRTLNNPVSATEWTSIGLICDSGQDRNDKGIAGGKIPRGSIEVRILRSFSGGWNDVFHVTNHSVKRRMADFEIEIGCPLADKEELKKKGGQSRKNGLKPRVQKEEKAVLSLHYERVFGKRKNAPTDELKAELGSLAPKDGETIRRELFVRVVPEANIEKHEPTKIQVTRGRISRVRVRISLEPRECQKFRIEFSSAIDGIIVAPPQLTGIEPLPRTRSSLPSRATRILTGNSLINLSLAQAATDLENFRLPVFGRPQKGPCSLLAGVPGYESYFGDDSLTGAWQSCILSPDYLRECLARAALYQGVRENPWRDEQIGRLAHQRRWGPEDVLGKRNKEIYYGDIETTPFWIISLATYFFWTGDLEFVRRHRPTLEGCLSWIQRMLKKGHGFLYYAPASKESTRNQGWKDSDSAIVDGRGEIVLPPLATAELQGYVFLAFLLASLLFFEMKSLGEAGKLFRQTLRFREHFNRRFWMQEHQYYALALDSRGRHVDSIASNAGHLLGCGIVPEERVPHVIGRLLSTEMFSGWGIRTLSSENPAFDPFSYHRGSIWAAENATIAAGMRLCGFPSEADQVIQSQLAAATSFRQLRNPEVIAGIERSSVAPIPGVYPDANPLQLWSISANPFSIQILLGLMPIAPMDVLLVDPYIPEWLSWVELHDLRVRDSVLNLRFWREKSGKSRWSVLSQSGKCKVIQQPMPFDPSASVWKRISAAAASAA